MRSGVAAPQQTSSRYCPGLSLHIHFCTQCVRPARECLWQGRRARAPGIQFRHWNSPHSRRIPEALRSPIQSLGTLIKHAPPVRIPLTGCDVTDPGEDEVRCCILRACLIWCRTSEAGSLQPSHCYATMISCQLQLDAGMPASMRDICEGALLKDGVGTCKHVHACQPTTAPCVINAANVPG